MKLERQSNSSTKKSSIDKFVKQQIEVLDFTPPPLKYWVKSESWKVIKQKIERADAKVIAWGLAMAATVSLTLAAGLQLSFNSLFNDGSEIEHKYTHKESQRLEKDPDTESANIQRVTPINKIHPILENNAEPEYLASTVIPSVELSSEYFDGSNDVVSSNLINKIINPYFSLGVSSQSVEPELGIDFLIFSKTNNFRVKQIKLGLSTELIQQRNEIEARITPYHFANLTYENIDSKTNKGWSVKTGMLLNSDSNYYKNTTVKLGLSRQFNKWLKFGPELIFTNNWKSIYPSLTLSLG